MRELPIDLDQIAVAMAEDPDVGTWYLDVETGETFLRSGMDGLDLVDGDAPDWMDERNQNIWRAIENGDARWEEIPHTSARESWRLMARFADTVSDDDVRARLADALDGRGAFSRFRRVLAGYPEEQKRWRAFEDQAARQEVVEWLESLGIRRVPRPRPEPGR